MAYLPNIPQPTDNLSVSQGQILDNFQALETIFALDHFAWDATNGGLHKQVTTKAQAAVTPATGFGAYYASLTGSVGGAITEAMYKSGDATNISLLSAVKGWAVCNSAGTVLDGYNIVFGTHAGTGQYTFTFTNALPDANYAVIGMCQMDTTFGTGGIMGYDSKSTAGFQINIRALSGGAVGANAPFGFVVLKS